MGARIRLRVEPADAPRKKSAGVEVVALANSGYEADASELLVPVSLARRLGLWPRPPRGAVSRRYQTPAGAFTAIRIPKALRIRVVIPGRALSPRVADAVIASTEREAIMSAELAGRLGIATIDPAKGVWALRTELTRAHPSAPAQYW